MGVCEKLYTQTLSDLTLSWFQSHSSNVHFISNFCAICGSLLQRLTRSSQRLSLVWGRRRGSEAGEGREDREREGGVDWLLQASREQDRWLDTGQSYTAKGCKRAMWKPCVCHLRTHVHSHTNAHVYTLTLVQSCAHFPQVMRRFEARRRAEKEGGTIWDCSNTFTSQQTYSFSVSYLYQIFWSNSMMLQTSIPR